MLKPPLELMKKGPRRGSVGSLCVLSVPSAQNATCWHVVAHMRVFVLPPVRPSAHPPVHPSPCSACWQGYLHYSVAVHQSPAPRQPCRLATRVRFTKGRLHPVAEGDKAEGKGEGQPASTFHLSACLAPVLSLRWSALCALNDAFGLPAG